MEDLQKPDSYSSSGVPVTTTPRNTRVASSKKAGAPGSCSVFAAATAAIITWLATTTAWAELSMYPTKASRGGKQTLLVLISPSSRGAFSLSAPVCNKPGMLIAMVLIELVRSAMSMISSNPASAETAATAWMPGIERCSQLHSGCNRTNHRCPTTPVCRLGSSAGSIMEEVARVLSLESCYVRYTCFLYTKKRSLSSTRCFLSDYFLSRPEYHRQSSFCLYECFNVRLCGQNIERTGFPKGLPLQKVCEFTQR